LQLWWLSSAPLLQVPPAGFARQLALESWQGLLAQLSTEGHQRVLLLGGAQLAGALLQEDLVDELQLTLCPLVLGGEHSWLPPSAQPQGNRWLLQEQRPLGDGEVLLRYQRKGNS
jgi:5-amino-6-(5-phosphoribosylamino)uracil reductase